MSWGLFCKLQIMLLCASSYKAFQQPQTAQLVTITIQNIIEMKALPKEAIMEEISPEAKEQFSNKDSLLGNIGLIVIFIGIFFIFALMIAGLAYSVKRFPKVREKLMKIKVFG